MINPHDIDPDGDGEFAVGFGDDCSNVTAQHAKQVAQDAVRELINQRNAANQALRDVIHGHIAELRQPIIDSHNLLRGYIGNRIDAARQTANAVGEAIRNKIRESIAYAGERLVDVYRMIPEAIGEPTEPPPPPVFSEPEPINTDIVNAQLSDAGELYRQLLHTPGALTALERGDFTPVSGTVGHIDTGGLGTDTIVINPPPAPPGGGGPPVSTPPSNCKPGDKYCDPFSTPIYDPATGVIISCYSKEFGYTDPHVCPTPPPPGGGHATIGCDQDAGKGTLIPGCTWVETTKGAVLCQEIYYLDSCGCAYAKGCVPVSKCWCKLNPDGSPPGCTVCLKCSPDDPCDPSLCPDGWSIDPETGLCMPPTGGDDTTTETPPVPGDGCSKPDDAPDDAQLVYGLDGDLHWTGPDGTTYGESCPGAEHPDWCVPVAGSPRDSEFHILDGGYGAWFDSAGTRLSDRCQPPCGLASVCEMPSDAPDDAIPFVMEDNTVQWLSVESNEFYGEPCNVPCPYPADAPDDLCLITFGDPPCIQWVDSAGKRYGQACQKSTGETCGLSETVEEPDIEDYSEPFGTGDFPDEPSLADCADELTFSGR